MDSAKSDAWLDGWHAHRNDVPGDENPYCERRQQRSREQWDAGWVARFSAIKHDGALDYDFR